MPNPLTLTDMEGRPLEGNPLRRHLFGANSLEEQWRNRKPRVTAGGALAYPQSSGATPVERVRVYWADAAAAELTIGALWNWSDGAGGSYMFKTMARVNDASFAVAPGEWCELFRDTRMRVEMPPGSWVGVSLVIKVESWPREWPTGFDLMFGTYRYSRPAAPQVQRAANTVVAARPVERPRPSIFEAARRAISWEAE